MKHINFRFLIHFSLSLLSISGGRSQLLANTEQKTFEIQVGAPIPFTPFTFEELINPETEQPYKSTDSLSIKTEGQEWSGTAGELLDMLNVIERYYASIGQSLRQMGDGNILVALNNSDLFNEQFLESLRLRSSILKSKIKTALKHCAQLTLDNLGIDLAAEAPLKLGDEITLPSSMQISVRDFIERINEQQRFLCSIGYDLLNDMQASLSTGGGGFDDGVRTLSTIEKIMQKRDNLLTYLGISKAHRMFNMQSIVRAKSIIEIGLEIDEYLKNKEMPSPEKMWALQKRINAELPADLQIPDLPAIPSPIMPKRSDLKLHKKKTWDFKAGDMNIGAAYASAWYEVRSSTKEMDVRGEGKAGAYLLGKEFNLIYGSGDFRAGDTEVAYDVALRVLGNDLLPESMMHGSKQISIVKEFANDPYELVVAPPPYKFIIAGIPVFIQGSLVGSLYVKYGFGLSLLKAYGYVTPVASARGRLEGGVGAKGLNAGAAGELTILDAEIPLRGEGAVNFDASGLPFMSVSLRSDFNYEYLSGRFYGFIEHPWFKCKNWKCGWTTKRHDQDLFSWGGVRGSQKIMNIELLAGAGGASARGDLLDQSDLDEINALSENINLEQRQQDLAALEQKLAEDEEHLWRAMKTEFNQIPTEQIEAITEYINQAEKINDEQFLALVDQVRMFTVAL